MKPLLYLLREPEVNMICSIQHCIPDADLQNKTTPQYVIKLALQVHWKLEKYTAFFPLRHLMSRLTFAIITPFETTHFNFTSSQVVNSYLEETIIPIHSPAIRREEYVDIREIFKCIPIHLQGQRFVCTFANSLHCID